MNSVWTGALFAVVLLGGCQRQPADVSGVAYQVLDEGRAGVGCRMCASPLPDAGCANGDSAAEVRWRQSAVADGSRLRLKVRRSDVGVLDIPVDGSVGKVTLPLELHAQDRVSLVDAGDSRELMFFRVGAPIGCELRSVAAAAR